MILDKIVTLIRTLKEKEIIDPHTDFDIRYNVRDYKAYRFIKVFMSKALLSIITIFLMLLAFIAPINAAQQAKDNPAIKFFSLYHDLGAFRDGLAPVKNEEKMLGYIDINGNLVIDYQFDTDRYIYNAEGYDFHYISIYGTREFYSGYNMSYIPGIYIYDKTLAYDAYISDNLPSSAFRFNRGYAEVLINGEKAYINSEGNEILNPFPGRYYYVWPFYQGIAIAQKTKGGLFGYIDRFGNEITKFKYLCASHFKNGVAKAVEAIPFKNGISRYFPGKHTDRMFHGSNEIVNYYNITEIDAKHFYPVRAANLPEGKDIIDVFLDTQGSVISWQFHEEKEIDKYFRKGIVFELEEVSEGLILKHDATGFWYEYSNGTVAFRLASNVTEAHPFISKKIAKIRYKDSGETRTGYIDSNGYLLDNAELENLYPYLFWDIIAVWIDPDKLLGEEYFVQEKAGVQYLVKNSQSVNLLNKKRKYFLVGRDNRIIMDCTDQIKYELANIYCQYQYKTYGLSTDLNQVIQNSDDFVYNEQIYLTRLPDSDDNIFYVIIRDGVNKYNCIGYMVLE